MVAEFVIDGEETFIDRAKREEKQEKERENEKGSIPLSGQRLSQTQTPSSTEENEGKGGQGGDEEGRVEEEEGETEEYEGGDDEGDQEEGKEERDGRKENETEINEIDSGEMSRDNEGGLEYEKSGESGAEVEVEEGKEGEEVEILYTSLPLNISSTFPTNPHTVSDFLINLDTMDLTTEDREFLYLPRTALSAHWASNRLSIVGKYCRRTYCFTHSYGRLYDKSSGSLYYEVR